METMLQWVDSYGARRNDSGRKVSEQKGSEQKGSGQRAPERLLFGVRWRPRSFSAGCLHTLLVVLIALQGSSTATAAGQAADEADGWRLDRERDGVRIYTRPLADSSFRAVRSTMTVPYPIAELVALVRDTEACAEWAHLCRSSRVIETLSETDVYVYTHNDLPWPISDRDAVARVTWTIDAATGSVTMRARATADKLPKNRGIVRLTNADTRWRFTPLADGQIEIVSEAHVDPGGPLPAWLINRMLLDAPYKTLANMRRIVASGRYADAHFEFLEPLAAAATPLSP